MATVEEVKAGVARFGDETARQVAQMRALIDSMEQNGALLRGITVGSNHARVAEALARVEQVKQKLNEAAVLAQGAAESARSYTSSF
jgi:hypothetical protein